MVKVLENSVVDLDVMPGKKGEDVKESVDGVTYVVLPFPSLPFPSLSLLYHTQNRSYHSFISLPHGFHTSNASPYFRYGPA